MTARRTVFRRRLQSSRPARTFRVQAPRPRAPLTTLEFRNRITSMCRFSLLTPSRVLHLFPSHATFKVERGLGTRCLARPPRKSKIKFMQFNLSSLSTPSRVLDLFPSHPTFKAGRGLWTWSSKSTHHTSHNIIYKPRALQVIGCLLQL